MSRSLFKISTLLFLLCFSFRLWGIFDLSVQVDEVHWRARSLEVISRAKMHDWTHVTTHLGQPGLPPALVMATSEYLGKKLNLLGRRIFDINLDYLHFARIGCAFVSSLIIYPLIILGSRLTTKKIAIIGALLITFCPSHVGLSKLAHLDTVMSTIVCLSILFYILSETEKRFDYKIYSGIFWGFAISTKPTAGLLPLGFLIWNFFRAVLKKIKYSEILKVSDLWAVFFGHLVFGIIYTRLWYHESDYLTRLKIQNIFADYVYQIGISLTFMWPLALMLVLILIYRGFVRSFLFLFSLTLLLYVLFPFIFESIVRFWIWGFGLSNVPHISFGVQAERLQMGYLGIILGDIFPITLLGMIGGSILIICRAIKYRKDSEVALFGLLIIAIVWTSILSVSSKQTIRYLLPVISPMFLIVGYFYFLIIEFLISKFKFKEYKRAYTAFLFFLSLFYVVSDYKTAPAQMMYENQWFNTKFRGGSSVRHSYNFGLNEIVRNIQSISDKEKEVFVLGGIDSLKLTQDIIGVSGGKIKFLPPRPDMSGHLVFRSHGLDYVFKGYVPSNINSFEFIYSSTLDKNPVHTLYRFPVSNYTEFEHFTLNNFFKSRGLLFEENIYKKFFNAKKCPDQFECIGVRQQKVKKGPILFGFDPYFNPGSYDFYFNILKVENLNTDKINLKPDTPLVIIKIGKQCQKVVTFNEINKLNFNQIKFSCTFNELKNKRIEYYWFGNSDLVLSNLAVIKKQGDPK